MTTTTSTGLPIRWHKIDEYAYRSTKGHYLFRMAKWDPSRIPGLGWRLMDTDGDWMDDYASAAKAKDSLRSV